MIHIILASKSQIRKEMLEKANIPFEVIVSNADETPNLSKSFGEQLKEIAMRKANTVFETTIDKNERVIVAADQNIVFNNIMYGKPKNLNEARNLIKKMRKSDNIYAYVGNAIIYANKNTIIKVINNYDVSRMSMDNISDKEVENYLTTSKPLDHCGGISILDAEFLHLEEGKMSTACAMTIEYLQELLASI